jgi:MOSC domain-containing protein YiiM
MEPQTGPAGKRHRDRSEGTTGRREEEAANDCLPPPWTAPILHRTMEARLLHVSVGTPKPLELHGETVPSSFRRVSVTGPLRLGPAGLAGDAFGDTTQHGGPDKAVCFYPFEHYAYWKRKLRTYLTPPAFGENLTTRGLRENGVCIGDLYRVGSTRIRVSQPRALCKKPGAIHNEPRLTRWMLLSGRTGFYGRCEVPGELKAGDRIVLLERGRKGITIEEANRIMYRDRVDLEAVRRLLAEESLATEWRRSLESRL